MHRKVRVSAAHDDGLAGTDPGQGPLDEDVGAAVEAEVLKVDSRDQR